MADTTVLVNGRQLAIADNGDGTYSLKVSSAGTSGGGTEFAEDAAHTTGDKGTLILAVRNDAHAALAGATGDYIPLTTDALGNLYIVTAGSENHVGEVGGWVNSVEVTPTITAGAYHANDVIGTAMAFADINRTNANGGVIQSFLIKDWANIKPALNVLIFSDNPSASTFTDNAAPLIHANDRAKLKRCFPIAASDWTTITMSSGAVAVIDLQGKMGGIVVPAAKTLYVVLQCTGTPTYVATTDLNISVGFLG
jgi:hypothetical protein